MKRLIKYWNQYNDNHFSNCSTEYEILDLVDDSFGYKELRQLAEIHGLETSGNCFGPKRRTFGLKITHAVKLSEPKNTTTGVYFRGDDKEVNQYLGFITLKDIEYLKPIESLNNKITKEQADTLVNYQDASVDNLVHIDSKSLLVIQDWDFYHILPLLGYSLESLYEALGIEVGEHTFSDTVDFCHNCGEYDWQDNGYVYNFRIVNECELLGVNCGCYDSHCQSDEGIAEFINEPGKCMESEAAEALEESGKLTFVERFCGGMTDAGRFHSYGGESVRAMNPDEVLGELSKSEPESNFVFVRDESGQFQTYYSVYKVN